MLDVGVYTMRRMLPKSVSARCACVDGEAYNSAADFGVGESGYTLAEDVLFGNPNNTAPKSERRIYDEFRSSEI